MQQICAIGGKKVYFSLIKDLNLQELKHLYVHLARTQTRRMRWSESQCHDLPGLIDESHFRTVPDRSIAREMKQAMPS